MDTELFKEWFQAFSQTAGITLHIENLYGENSHHIVESCFKGLARSLREAIKLTIKELMKFLQQKGHLEGRFNFMSLYCILEKKSNSLDVNIAKIGFSKLAFVFSFIWGFSNGIYLYAMLSFLFFIISLCLTFFGVLGFEAFVIMMLLNSFYWGIFGNVIFINF